MRKVLLSLLCLVISLVSVAQPQSGKVYNLKNVGKGNSLGITSLFKVIGVTTNEDDLSQQWYVESVSGSTFTLRNLASGFYLQGNNSTSGAWNLVSAKVDLEYTNDSGAFAIRQSEHTDTYIIICTSTALVMLSVGHITKITTHYGNSKKCHTPKRKLTKF